jgi:WD40 repeat protein
LSSRAFQGGEGLSASTGALLKTYQPAEGIERAALSSDGSKIVTAGLEGGIGVWGTRSGADLLTINSHTGPINSAEFSRDGSRIVSAGVDGTARIWSAFSGAQLLSLSSGHEALNHASFSPDGSQVLTAGQDGTARVWDAHSGAQLLVLNGARLFIFKRLPYAGINDARFNPDASRIATASEDGMALIWSTELAGPLRLLERMARSLVTRPFTPQERKTYLTGIAG